MRSRMRRSRPNSLCEIPAAARLQDRWDAVNGEHARRLAGVCEGSNDQVAPYGVDIAARLQAIAEHLKETHGQLVEDFRRVVVRIEQNKSGAKTGLFAPADRFLSESKIIAIEGAFVTFTPAKFLGPPLCPIRRIFQPAGPGAPACIGASKCRTI
jgi:hypothetical protein